MPAGSGTVIDYRFGCVGATQRRGPTGGGSLWAAYFLRNASDVNRSPNEKISSNLRTVPGEHLEYNSLAPVRKGLQRRKKRENKTSEMSRLSKMESLVGSLGGTTFRSWVWCRFRFTKSPAITILDYNYYYTPEQVVFCFVKNLFQEWIFPDDNFNFYAYYQRWQA